MTEQRAKEILFMVLAELSASIEEKARYKAGVSTDEWLDCLTALRFIQEPQQEVV